MSGSEQKWLKYFKRDGFFIISLKRHRQYGVSHQKPGRRTGFIEHLRSVGHSVGVAATGYKIICYDPLREEVLPEWIKRTIVEVTVARFKGDFPM